MDEMRARFGKLRFGLTWYGWLFIIVAIVVFLGGVLRGYRSGPFGPIAGTAMLVFAIMVFHKAVFFLPAVETSVEGITLRPSIFGGRVFVKWEDAEEVVIWYKRTGGDQATMIGIRLLKDAMPDNYGKYRTIVPNSTKITGPYPVHVGDSVGQWSVNVGGTKAKRIAELVNASRKNLPVTENPLWSNDVRSLSDGT